jgi:predicted RNase H-like HicB family nuclease
MNDSLPYKRPLGCGMTDRIAANRLSDFGLTNNATAGDAKPIGSNRVDAFCPFSVDATVRGTTLVGPTIDPIQPAKPKAVEGRDRGFTAATPEEIRHAHELRLQLEKKYLNQPSTPVSPVASCKGHEMKFEIECERKEDGRWLAEVPQLPGVRTYGSSADDAMAKAEILALRVLADKLEHGESRPQSISIAVAAK